MGTRVPGARCRGRALAFALVAVALVPVAAESQTLSDLIGLLQPGSRPSLALGGDPFRSAVNDQDGWWQELGLSREPGVTLEGVWSEPLHSDLTNLQRALTGRWVVDPPGVRGRLRLGGQVVAPNWGICWAGGDGAVRLGGSGVGGIVGARVRELLPGLTVQGVSPTFGGLKGVRGPAAGGGIRYRLLRVAVLQASWETNRSPELLRSNLYGELIQASLNLHDERARVDAAVTLPGRLHLEGSAARDDFKDHRGREDAPVYHLAPRGRSTLAQASVAWDSPIGWRVLGRYTRRDLDVCGTAAWGGQRFAELSSARAGQESYLIAAEHGSPGGPRWLLDGEVARANARARLELETWPFTSSTVDLLGLRRIYRALGDAHWHRVHVALEYPFPRRGHVCLGLSGYDIAPGASLESWRPVFLVFGGTDRQFERLGTRRLQLAALSLGLGLAIGSSQVEIAAQQFVFAKAFPTAVPAVDGGVQDPTGGASVPHDSRSGWSGIEVRASISRAFGSAASR